MAGLTAFFISAAFLVFFLFTNEKETGSRLYMVEVNRMMKGLEKDGYFSEPDLRFAEEVSGVNYLELSEPGQPWDSESFNSFFAGKRGLHRHIEPFIKNGRLTGLVGFDYQLSDKTGNKLWLAEGIVLASWGILMAVLFMVKKQILIPFHSLSNMPYELAKGRLKGELEENKSRFFGKFVWGIAMLRDHLSSVKDREMKLEKEKKMLLLSISHDIKTPVNTIKLYAKALEEGVYGKEEDRRQAAVQIQALSSEIEGFVKEIVRNTSQDILHLEVEMGEFYLEELVELVRAYFEPKCRLIKVELEVGEYKNRLVKGSLDSAFEVIENLMENAFKYGDGKKIEIGFGEEEYCQLVWVWNSGECVAEGEMIHLFDSFYRGSNVGAKSGNGLGLYICREIMKKMEGEIFAQAGDGMKFVLVFS